MTKRSLRVIIGQMIFRLFRESGILKARLGRGKGKGMRKKLIDVAPVGRPVVYGDESRVYLHATGRAKLQAGSDRRAIVNVLVENGGSMTMRELDEHFGFDVRDRVLALKKAGWVRIEKLEKKE